MRQLKKLLIGLTLTAIMSAPSAFAWCGPNGCYNHYYYHHSYYYNNGNNYAGVAAVGLLAGAAIGYMAANSAQPQNVYVNQVYTSPAPVVVRRYCTVSNGYEYCKVVRYYN